MTKEIAATFQRSRGTLVSDALGATAVVVILLVGLFLPGLI